VCEIAAIRLRANGMVLEELSTLVHPGRSIPRQAQQIHASATRATEALPADGFEVHDQDVAHLSPFTRHHLNMLGLT
jgi:hypothetical protein